MQYFATNRRGIEGHVLPKILLCKRPRFARRDRQSHQRCLAENPERDARIRVRADAVQERHAHAPTEENAKRQSRIGLKRAIR